MESGAVQAPLEVLTQEAKEERLKYIMNKLRESPDMEFVNFIARCLEWDPEKRLTPEEGLSHVWITKGLPPNIVLHNPHNNPYQRVKQNNSVSSNRGKLSHREKPSEQSSIVLDKSAQSRSSKQRQSSQKVKE